jgi:hypothetical protein
LVAQLVGTTHRKAPRADEHYDLGGMTVGAAPSFGRISKKQDAKGANPERRVVSRAERGGWVTFDLSLNRKSMASVYRSPQSKARIAGATGEVDTFKMMTTGKQMPSAHFADYAFVFN